MKALLFLFILWGCGEDLGGTRITEQTDEEEEEIFPISPQGFNTRLSKNLLVSGEICRGTETIIINNETFSCFAKQYLLRLDNVNTCDNAGICTTFVVPQIIVELEDTNAQSPGFKVYDFQPVIPITNEQENILETIGLRADFNGNSNVFFKQRPLERGQ